MSLKSLTQLFTLIQISAFRVFRKRGRITFVSPHEQSFYNLFVERRGEAREKRLVLSQYEYSKKQRNCFQGDVLIETYN